MTYTMGDWSNPGTSIIKNVDAFAFYIGGWTPHVWTQTQIDAQTAHWALPIWVYDPNQPGSAKGQADGKAALSALDALNVPSGVRVVADMEGSIDEPYLAAFRNVIGPAGYHMCIYGGPSTIFQNWPQNPAGPGGGWWVADWAGIGPFLYNHEGVWATQWTNSTSTTPWDQSVIADLTMLWWHKPVTYSFTAKATDKKTSTSASKNSSFVVQSP